jgi:hypothetical protein
MVTPQDIAARLNNIEYRTDIAQSILDDAKTHGLVIVTGASDDLIEFEGAAYEEYSCYGGATIPVGKDGEPIFGCEEPCDHCQATQDAENAKTKIEAKWAFNDYSWFIDINLDPKKYGAFNVLEDGETYCRGIVFAIEDIQ